MWIKLDDQITHHPKLVMAGPEASWLYVGGLCYAARYLTNGFLPKNSLCFLIVGRRLRPLSKLLVKHGLWHEVDGGWQIHDYADYQPTVEEVERRREVRRNSGREGGRRSGDARRSKAASKNEANASFDAKQNASPEEAKTNPVPVPVIRTHTPRARNQSIGAQTSPLAWHKAHREHAWCGERICTPGFLHEEFLRNLGGDRDEQTVWLKGIYAEADADLQKAERKIEDALKFLREWFAAAVKRLRKPDALAHIPEWFHCDTCGGAHRGTAGDPCPDTVPA